MKKPVKGLFLIAAGGLALAHNLGYLNVNLTDLIRIWWPVILIIVGIGFFFPSNH